MAVVTDGLSRRYAWAKPLDISRQSLVGLDGFVSSCNPLDRLMGISRKAVLCMLDYDLPGWYTYW